MQERYLHSVTYFYFGKILCIRKDTYVAWRYENFTSEDCTIFSLLRLRYQVFLINLLDFLQFDLALTSAICLFTFVLEQLVLASVKLVNINEHVLLIKTKKN